MNGAREFLTTYEVPPLSKYVAYVTFSTVYADVVYEHYETGAIFQLRDIYFDEADGKILQAVLTI